MTGCCYNCGAKWRLYKESCTAQFTLYVCKRTQIVIHHFTHVGCRWEWTNGEAEVDYICSSPNPPPPHTHGSIQYAYRDFSVAPVDMKWFSRQVLRSKCSCQERETFIISVYSMRWSILHVYVLQTERALNFTTHWSSSSFLWQPTCTNSMPLTFN